MSYGTFICEAPKRCGGGVFFSDPGPDLTWFTADDVSTAYSDASFTESESGIITRQTLRYADAGPDQVRFTLDDTVQSYDVGVFDDKFAALALAEYDDPGQDGVWLSDDDLPSPGYFEWVQDANGNFVMQD